MLVLPRESHRISRDGENVALVQYIWDVPQIEPSISYDSFSPATPAIATLNRTYEGRIGGETDRRALSLRLIGVPPICRGSLRVHYASTFTVSSLQVRQQQHLTEKRFTNLFGPPIALIADRSNRAASYRESSDSGKGELYEDEISCISVSACRRYLARAAESGASSCFHNYSSTKHY
jgi:hypothetical protein